MAVMIEYSRHTRPAVQITCAIFIPMFAWESWVEIIRGNLQGVNLAENERNSNMEAIKYRNLIEYPKDLIVDVRSNFYPLNCFILSNKSYCCS